jgi:hypothetical protein
MPGIKIPRRGAQWSPPKFPPDIFDPKKLAEKKVVLVNKSKSTVFASLARGDFNEGNPGWFKVVAGDKETWHRFIGSSDMRFIISKNKNAVGALSETEISVSANGGWTITWDGVKMLFKTKH